MSRPVIVISDRSGLTAETMSRTLLSQFPRTEFRYTALPFVDSEEKLDSSIDMVNAMAVETGQRPLVFVTFVDERLVSRLSRANAEVFDLFNPFIGRLEEILHEMSSHQVGQAHGMSNIFLYHQRINAVNFALHCDDGLHSKDYDNASLILVGVSRSGKTPTCLYLAMHFGFHAANYPLTEEDFDRGHLPEVILGNRHKVFGLTIDPLRLQQIRSERRPESRYASIAQCRDEVLAAIRMFARHDIPYCDSTAYSVEELGSTIKHRMGLESMLF